MLIRFVFFFTSLTFVTAFSFENWALTPAATPQTDKAKKIANYFNRVKSMSGDFIQLAENGEKTEGKFLIQRPGKLRFTYNAPLSHEIISDGQSIVILNKKLKTSNLYPLSKTPLKFLLGNQIDLSEERIDGIEEENGATRLELKDKSPAGLTKILLIFEHEPWSLKEWRITDNKGERTTVMLLNTQENVSIDPSLFKINYTLNRVLNQKKGNH